MLFSEEDERKMENKKTVLYEDRVTLGAKMVDFAGYLMPIQYPAGILAEHLAARKQAGIFDVSHMGRFRFTGKDALAFLQHTLTNNSAALEVGTSQYALNCIEGLVAKGAQGIVLGCTELPFLLSQKDRNVKLFDTTKIHAQKTLELALGEPII